MLISDEFDSHSRYHCGMWWVNPNGSGAGCEPAISEFDSRHSPQSCFAAVRQWCWCGLQNRVLLVRLQPRSPSISSGCGIEGVLSQVSLPRPCRVCVCGGVGHWQALLSRKQPPLVAWEFDSPSLRQTTEDRPLAHVGGGTMLKTWRRTRFDSGTGSTPTSRTTSFRVRSNGRTVAFEAADRGSNPRPGSRWKASEWTRKAPLSTLFRNYGDVFVCHRETMSGPRD